MLWLRNWRNCSSNNEPTIKDLPGPMIPCATNIGAKWIDKMNQTPPPSKIRPEPVERSKMKEVFDFLSRGGRRSTNHHDNIISDREFCNTKTYDSIYTSNHRTEILVCAQSPHLNVKPNVTLGSGPKKKRCRQYKIVMSAVVVKQENKVSKQDPKPGHCRLITQIFVICTLPISVLFRPNKIP